MNNKQRAGLGLGVVVVVAAAIAGGAAWSGRQVQARIEAQGQQAQALAPLVRIVDETYQRGLFTAAHSATLVMGCPNLAAGTPGAARPVFTLRERISHGPFLGGAGFGAALIESELLPADAASAASGTPKVTPWLTARTLVDFGGGYRSHVEAPAGRHEGPAGESMSWQGLQADVTGGDAKTPVRYEMTMPGLEIAGSDANSSVKLTLGRIHAKGETTGAGMVWLRPGKVDAELASFAMAAEGKAGGATPMPGFAFVLENLVLGSTTTLEKDLLGGTGKLAGRGSFGATKVEQFEMLASMKRLHAPSYALMMEHLMAGACESPAGQRDPKAVLALIQRDTAALLPFNPEYALDKLTVQIDGQRGELSYTMGFDGVTEAEARAPMAAMATLSKARLAGQAKLPVAWVVGAMGAAQDKFSPAQGVAADPAARAAMLNVMIDKVVGEGYVQRDGENLSSSVRFEKGQFSVNGKPLGPPVGAPPVLPR